MNVFKFIKTIYVILIIVKILSLCHYWKLVNVHFKTWKYPLIKLIIIVFLYYSAGLFSLRTRECVVVCFILNIREKEKILGDGLLSNTSTGFSDPESVAVSDTKHIGWKIYWFAILLDKTLRISQWNCSALFKCFYDANRE